MNEVILEQDNMKWMVANREDKKITVSVDNIRKQVLGINLSELLNGIGHCIRSLLTFEEMKEISASVGSVNHIIAVESIDYENGKFIYNVYRQKISRNDIQESVGIKEEDLEKVILCPKNKKYLQNARIS